VAVQKVDHPTFRENPLWGAPRIHGELLKLGIDVGETSVGKYVVRRRRPPSQTWRTFLENHVKSLAPPQSGPPSKSETPFRGTPRHGICCGIAIGSSATNSPSRFGIWAASKVLSAPRSPWQRAYIERLIGTLRRDCLDHMIVFGEASLYRQVKLFVAYYHESRTHLSLAKDAPEPRPASPPELGPVVAIPQVGGLHHRYERRAA
jgi:hypothetical protein